MQRDRPVGRGRADASHRAAGKHQHVRIGADHPFHKHHEDQRRGRAEDARGRRRAPRNGQRGGREQAEYDHRAVGVMAVQHDQCRADQIGGERAG